MLTARLSKHKEDPSLKIIDNKMRMNVFFSAQVAG